ncbi:hypothetical protein ERO13_A04G058463v2 [Gossypium hirsutum]|nr:hypothetical protein ERO13_A04G058463v2 [Gossypium hirsutum]KAG4204602.1 hypothetical protein ERO13_A04G058463v2 [Gossypium hirsutum]
MVATRLLRNRQQKQSFQTWLTQSHVRLQLVFFLVPFIRSNNLVSCHYIFHNWGPWWLRNMVSPSLLCYEGCIGHGC